MNAAHLQEISDSFTRQLISLLDGKRYKTSSAYPLKVLLIRTESIQEVLQSHAFIDLVREVFPQSHITVTVTEGSSAKEIIADETNPDEKIPVDAAAKFNPLKMWKLYRRHHFDCSIAVYFTETPQRQPQRLLSLLLCPGKRIIYWKGKFIPLLSWRGGILAFKATREFISRKLIKRLRLLKKRPISCSNMDISKLPIKRILWMRPDYLGDVVLSLPAMYLLKEYFPDAEIDALVSHNSAAILEGVKEINITWKVNFADFTDNPTPKSEMHQILSQMKERRYDLAVDLLGADCVREVAYKLKIPQRVGFSDYAGCASAPDYSYMLTHAVKFPKSKKHDSQNRTDLLRAVGLKSGEVPLRLDVSEKMKLAVQVKLQTLGITRPFAVLHTYTNDAMRRWTQERFAKVADYLVDTYQMDVLLTGASADKEYVEAVREKSQYIAHVYNACGYFKICELPALFEKTSVMITVDTGPVHIAAAVGTPVVALVLPFYETSFPFGQRESTLIPLQDNNGKSTFTLETITIDDVCKEIDKKWSVNVSIG